MPNKTVLAAGTKVSRRSLYYAPKQPAKDWHTKQLIETALRDHPSYGHKCLAVHLGINKKRVLRLMQIQKGSHIASFERECRPPSGS